MKKLLGILVLGLLLSSKVYAEEKINLICKYLNSYYVSWDQGMFGETIVDESIQDSINFSIVKSNWTREAPSMAAAVMIATTVTPRQG